jgi:hypothetical protein
MQELSGTDGQLDRDNSSPGREVASCTAELNEVEPRCGVCRDRFEQFYNEEKEEWQLRRAVRVDGVAYHPMCYQDHLVSYQYPFTFHWVQILFIIIIFSFRPTEDHT